MLANGPYVGTAWAVCGVLAAVALAGWLWLSTGSMQETTEGAFSDADPLVRAAYGPQASDAELIVLASDTDWRVRAAAFEALSRKESIKQLPLRDTPIDERETLILNWLDRNRPGLSADICSIYAGAEHVRYGSALAGRCLTCHTGRQPQPEFRDTSCVNCHRAIHSDWAGTAHANSLSHLVLPTVDTTTRQPGTYDFAGLMGLSCTACHEPQGVNKDSQKHACLATFNTQSCQTCHTRTGAQWDEWTQAPHYRPAAWPPGSVEQINDAEPKSCTDCHMPDGQHLWGARRDIALLRSGVVMKIQEEGGGAASLVLQNLAGHAYPSGGVRRALRLYMQIDDQTETLLATLADDPGVIAQIPDVQPALQPGETRMFPLPQSTEEVRVRLVYIRNRFDKESYTIDVKTVNQLRPDPAYMPVQ